MANYDVKQEVTDKYSLRGRVFHKLREDILNGRYKDFEELREVAIGEEMGVSRTPVREAFRQLELEGMILYVGGEPVAVTMGSRLAEDTFDVHFEKAREDIQGAYGAINRAFARHLREKYPDLLYLNREDDLGLPGLRKAKLSYNPAFLVEKCWAYLAEEAYDD